MTATKGTTTTPLPKFVFYVRKLSIKTLPNKPAASRVQMAKLPRGVAPPRQPNAKVAIGHKSIYFSAFLLSFAKSRGRDEIKLLTELLGVLLFFTDICGTGKYNDGNDVCIPCAIGFYQDQDDQFYCKPCDADKTTTLTGTEKEEDCKGMYTAHAPPNPKEVRDYLFEDILKEVCLEV